MTLTSVPLLNQNLCGFFNSENKITKFLFSKDGGTAIEIPIENVLINQQPINCLAGFDFSIIKKEDLVGYVVIQNKIYFNINSQKKISLTIIICKHISRKYEVSPNLQVAGLKEMLRRDFILGDFKISDEKGGDLSNTALFGEKCDGATLLLKKYDFSKNEASKENKNWNNLSHESSTRGIKFVDFKNKIFIPTSEQKSGLYLIGFCEGNCKLKHFAYKGVNKKIEGGIKEILNTACPTCESTSFKIRNCAFLNCSFTINTGTENYNGQTSNDMMLSFEDDDKNGVRWTNLTIETKELSTSPQEKKSKFPLLNITFISFLGVCTLGLIGSIYIWKNKN